MDDGSEIIMEFIIAAAYLSAGKHCRSSLEVEDFFWGIKTQCIKKKGWDPDFIDQILCPFKDTTLKMSKALNQ